MPLRRSEGAVHPDDADPQVTEVVSDPVDLKAAYDRGRRDERRGRRRHPILMMLTFLAAAVGVFALVMAAYRGSFQSGGASIDRNLEAAADRAAPVVRDTVARTGEAVQGAGETLKAKAPETGN